MSNIKYFLIDNYLTSDNQKTKTARVIDTPIANTEDLITRVAYKNSDIDVPTFLKDLNAFFEEIQLAISHGEAVDLPILKSSFSIRGVFHSNEDVYTEGRHTKVLNFTPSASLSKSIDNIPPEKSNYQPQSVRITDLEDISSLTKDVKLTPNGILNILGQNLKLSTHPDAGIFFIDVEGVQKIKATHVSTNKPKKLSVQIPNLAAGEWRVAVHTSHSETGVIKTGEFAKTVRVDAVE